MDNSFDFFIGTWDSKQLRRTPFTDEPWDEFPGHSRSWSAFDGAANIDEIIFPTKHFSGMTVRLLNRDTDGWSLYWVNSRTGLSLPPVLGRFGDDGVGLFTGADVHDGRPIKVYYRWSDITTMSCRWEQGFSLDDGATWDVNWIMEFTRTD